MSDAFELVEDPEEPGVWKNDRDITLGAGDTLSVGYDVVLIDGDRVVLPFARGHVVRAGEVSP